MQEVVLGRKYRDKITGLVGIADSKHEDINGMIQYAINPGVDKDGKMRDTYLIDPANLIDVETEQSSKSAKTGGPTTRVEHD